MTLSGSGEASREGSSAKTADASKSLVFAAPPSCAADASAAGLTSTSTADVVNVWPGFGFCAFEDEEAALDGGAGVGTSGSTSASRNAGVGVATSGSPALCSGACCLFFLGSEKRDAVGWERVRRQLFGPTSVRAFYLSVSGSMSVRVDTVASPAGKAVNIFVYVHACVSAGVLVWGICGRTFSIGALHDGQRGQWLLTGAPH